MFIQKYLPRIVFLLILSLIFPVRSFGQNEDKTPTPTPTPEIISENPDDDVLKINTNLIQTGVTVIDKQGKFVDKLTREDFELKVGGKPLVLSFFEPVIGSKSGTDRQTSPPSGQITNEPAEVNERGRTILFVVDDLHLSFESHVRTKELILKFIENEIIPNDLIAIVSTTGKIGFLQQFTNDKMVLREAVERIHYNRNYSAADRMSPPMSEYEALLIERLDPEVTNIFARQIVREIPGYDLESAKTQARSRASSILFQANLVTRNTLSVLEQAVRRSARIPGRKMVMFLSDGFLVDPQNSDSTYHLQRITDAASRTNTVIYSFDVKGLEAGLPEGTSATSTATGYRVQAGERFEVQDGLSSLAYETGGRFIHNRNDIGVQVEKAIVEASGYYLLAWEPDSEIGAKDKLSKIEVSVKGRPDLKVRFQTGYFSRVASSEKAAPASTVKNTPEVMAETQLTMAAGSQYTESDLPTLMVLNYFDMPEDGALLAAALQIKNEALEFTKEANQSFAKVDFLGIIYNSEGKREGYFRERMTVTVRTQVGETPEKPDMFYNYQAKLKPGLYQIRVAARDVKSGRLGNAIQWIKIPDLAQRKLALSSLVIGERTNVVKQVSAAESVLEGATISVDRRFSRTSNLRYFIFIYNASRSKAGGGLPEVFIQTRILSQGNIISDGQFRSVITDGQDLERLSYAAEIPLSSLTAGKYELQVTVQDRAAKSGLMQKIAFEVK